jgi:drug/metabolite transporter (DMT)-like permease
VSNVSVAVGTGLICALLSALGTNLAFLFKHRGAVAAPDVDIRHPVRSAIDLFRSKWWSIGWAVAAVAFALHVAALSLAPISIAQAVLAGGLVFLAVLAERFFGFELGRRQWIGIGLVAVSLSLLTVTGGGGGGGAHSGYSLAGMIIFEAIAVGVGLLVVFSHLIERIRAQPGVLLGVAAGLGFGISDVAIKALSGDRRIWGCRASSGIRGPAELVHEVDGRLDDPALCADGAGVGARNTCRLQKPRVGGSEEPGMLRVGCGSDRLALVSEDEPETSDWQPTALFTA